MEKESQKEYQWKNVKHQYYAALAANLIVLGNGTIAGWVSPALAILTSDETPLKSGPLTNEEVSWIGSASSIGAILGIFSFGYLLSLLGCKRTMNLLPIPAIISWTLIYFGDSFYYILFARITGGWLSGGLRVTLIVYISEIANSNIRGRLSSFTGLFRNIGTLLAFIIGSMVDYEQWPQVFVIIQIIYMIAFILLPNTPQFHLRNDRLEEAEKALKYYKGYEGKTVEEMDAFAKELDDLKSVARDRKVEKELGLKDFCEKDAFKGIVINWMMGFICQMTGYYNFINYAALIFEKTDTSIDPNICSIAVATVPILGNICTTQIVDTLGRRFSSVSSLFGIALGNGLLALFLYLHQNHYDLSSYSWIPVTCISFVMFIASAGVISVSEVYAVEHLPLKIRNTGVVISRIAGTFSEFAVAKLFPILMGSIDLHGCLLIFSIGPSLGILFIIFVMDETKGRSINSVDR